MHQPVLWCLGATAMETTVTEAHAPRACAAWWEKSLPWEARGLQLESPTVTEAHTPRACAAQQEKSLPWEARGPQLESPGSLHLETSPHAATKTQHKNKKKPKVILRETMITVYHMVVLQIRNSDGRGHSFTKSLINLMYVWWIPNLSQIQLPVLEQQWWARTRSAPTHMSFLLGRWHMNQAWKVEPM